MSPWFEEFARVNDVRPESACPGCGRPALFSTAFKKMGQHRVHVCIYCRATFHNGERTGDLEVSPEALVSLIHPQPPEAA